MISNIVMFSVIIPLYNKAAYIEKAIRSVLNQTYQEFELIVVNDGSSDDSLMKLQFTIRDLQLSKEKIIILDQKNQGVSTARNNGVKVANYDFIAFLDADDWWKPTYLDEMMAFIQQFPEAGIYGSSYYIVKNGKLIVANIGVEDGFKKGLINYFHVYAKNMYMPLWTGATILKKTIFESEKGFKPCLRFGEDFDLWIRIAMKYPVALLNIPLAYYNQDVELENRAVNDKLYKSEQHMLFSNYEILKNNIEFQILFEKLAVYSLLPYYLDGNYKNEVNNILKNIHWNNHPFKYRLYYLILPIEIVTLYIWFLKKSSNIKKYMIRNGNESNN